MLSYPQLAAVQKVDTKIDYGELFCLEMRKSRNLIVMDAFLPAHRVKLYEVTVLWYMK